jgi:hypothetical protein
LARDTERWNRSNEWEAAGAVGGVEGLGGGYVGRRIRASAVDAVGEKRGGARCEVGATHT